MFIQAKDRNSKRYNAKNFLNISRLDKGYRNLIRSIYKQLIRIQARNRRIYERHGSLSIFSYDTNSIQPVDNNSLVDYAENYQRLTLDKSQKSDLDKKLDSFSSVLPLLDKKEQTTMIKPSIEDEYRSKIEPIQDGMMPEWNHIEANEKSGIINLYERWENSVNGSFTRIRTGQKAMRSLNLNETKLINKGEFKFEANMRELKRIQLDLLDICSGRDQEKTKTKNTRLILRSFKEFLATMESLHEAKQSIETNSQPKQYWTYINRTLSHLSKAVLRCAFYIHENAGLYRASIGLPPMYILESDDLNNRELPNVRLETLFEYVYVCFNQIKLNSKIQQPNSPTSSTAYNNTRNNNNNKTTKGRRKGNGRVRNELCYFKIMLICLLRLVQIGVIIRENLIMKKIRYEKGISWTQAVDADIYAHFIFNQTKLVYNNLKQILVNF